MKTELVERFRPSRCLDLGDRSLVGSVLKSAEECQGGFCVLDIWQEGLTMDENENLLELMGERRIIRQVDEDDEIGRKWYVPVYGERRGLILIGPFAEEIHQVGTLLPDGHWSLPLERRYTSQGGERLCDVIDLMRSVDHDLCIMEIDRLEHGHQNLSEEISRECERGERDGRSRRVFKPRRLPVITKAYECGYVLGDLGRFIPPHISPECSPDVF